MFEMTSSIASIAPGLRWLIRLRWLSLAGQCLLFATSAYFLHIALPLAVLLPCLAITAGSNLFVTLRGDKFRETECCAALLLLDTLTLSVILYSLGGPHNPFTAFYLLHVTIAAVLLPALWTWIGVILCSVCYALLFLSPYEIKSELGVSCCGSFDFHLQGMLLAMILVGICIAFFVGQLKSALAIREVQLQEAMLLGVRNEKFAGLATLAAGVAHELATPLNTIAIISADLQKQACNQCESTGCLHDAKLIRSEVDRCRAILEKLAENTTDKIGENPQSFLLGDIPLRLREFLSPANYSRISAEVTEPRLTVFVPSTTLLQALAVLVKNACEADESGHPVTLRIETDRERVLATVQDRGPGMTADVAAHAGEPFFTTKDPGKGMGLGLFLVRMFTERMKGRLRIESDLGRGTRVSMEFPLTA
ncbi:MAG: hypothetical protein BGO12_22535 [Verrucomicrobia bacterium 61-8]|nr:MAG: hypothetical protein BGO12_22535 [Verrucomicrobia bacterium 61-8]